VTSGLSNTVYASASKTWLKDNQRIGQAVFNALHSIDPEIADIVRGSALDPFYEDERLPEFWAWLDGWEK